MANERPITSPQNRANFLYLFVALLVFTIAAPVMEVSFPTIMANRAAAPGNAWNVNGIDNLCVSG